MKIIKKMTPVALATTMALAGLAAAPGAANAEVSASMGVANFYLWRGLDISAGAPQVSGSLDYSHDSGLYAGVWASSEEAGTETDLYIGFAGEVSGFSYDISYWDYLYPSDNPLTGTGDKFTDNSISESVLGVGYAGVGLTFYMGNDVAGGADYTYTTLDYTYDKFNVLYGMWSVDATGADESSHITFSYAATDNFTFTVTKGMQDVTPGLDPITGDPTGSVYDEDPLFHVSYSIPVEM